MSVVEQVKKIRVCEHTHVHMFMCLCVTFVCTRKMLTYI